MSIESVLSGERRWTVIEADSFDLMATLPDSVIDVVITDPPYYDVVHKHGRSTSTWKDSHAAGIQQFSALEDPAALSEKLVKLAKRWAVAFCALEQLAAYREGCGSERWVRSGVWDKIVPGPQVSADRPGQAVEGLAIMHRKGRKRWNRGGGAGIWRCLPAHGAERFGHPSPKPVKLMSALVSDFSEQGEVVFDPFAGTGTTGVAALALGRRVILVEKNPEYAAICRARLDAEERSASVHAERMGQASLFSKLTEVPPEGHAVTRGRDGTA